MLTDAQITRLLDVANAGCHKGMVTQARTVYAGVLAVRPGHVPALIGQALSHIVISEFDQAEEQLKAILAGNADDFDAQALLGLCLFLADKKDEAREVLEPLQSREGSSAALVASLLEQLD